MTQNEQILEYLLQFPDITPMDALSQIGCMRLGARIWELKNKYKVAIETRKVTVKTRSGTADVAAYSLLDKASARKALEQMGKKTA